MKRHNASAKRYIGRHLTGMLKATIMQRRRETVYRMLAKKHAGKVPCWVCGEHVAKPAATLEHVVPRSRGGTDEISNLSISHGRCNQARGNKTAPDTQDMG